MNFSKLSPEQMKVAEMVIEAAEANNIDPNLLLAQAYRESAFKHIPNKETDAFGVMQIRPGTAEQNKLGDITDLRTNIFGGARLMRQYLDKYQSPEAALIAYHQGPGVADSYIKSGGDLKAVGPKGLDYVISIGENGGFGQPSAAGGDEGASTNPFAGYQSEAGKFKREQDEAEQNKPPEANPEDKQGGINAPEMGAIAGAATNLLFPPMTNPELPTKIDTTKAQERALETADKLELARRNLSQVAPTSGVDLNQEFAYSQGEMERLKNEQRLAEAQLKGLPKTPVSIETPSSTPAQVDAPSRTKAGDPGAVNWVRSMAEGVPDVVAEQALNMRGDNPRGGQAIIDADMAARKRQADLGLGDYDLARTSGGVQLALPPTTVAERQADEARLAQENQAELERRAEEARVQQEAQARELEAQRLSREAELERLRERRAQAGQRLNQVKQQRQTVAPFERAVTRAETDAEIAQRRLDRAKQQPSAAGRVLDAAGVRTAKTGALPRAALGAGAGYLGVMSYQEALKRFEAGDTSEGVLKALQAGAAGLTLLPPVGKGATRARGAGVAGTLGLGAVDVGRRLLKERPPEE